MTNDRDAGGFQPGSGRRSRKTSKPLRNNSLDATGSFSSSSSLTQTPLSSPSSSSSSSSSPRANDKRGPRRRLSNALDLRNFALASYSSLCASISLVEAVQREERQSRLVPWSSIESVTVRFAPRSDADAIVNSWVLGLRSMQAGGTRSWDPRRLVDSSNEEKDGQVWPQIQTSTGHPPIIDVVYRTGRRRSFSPELLSQEQIMREVLTGPAV
ncbi:hypothetical protein JCM10212_005840 [Sporobolomyces blumeae]